MHGVTHTIQQIRDRGVPGFEVEVIGTDADVDRRLSAVAEIDIPFYRGLKIGVPSLPAIVDALAEGRYDLVHLCSPGPAGSRRLAAGARARAAAASAATTPSSRRTPGCAPGRPQLEALADDRAGEVLRRLRRGPVAEPGHRSSGSGSSGSPPSGSGAGTAASTSGGSTRRCATPGLLPGEINVLYAGRLTKEKGVELLADAFLAARGRDPRLHLVLAGGGPEEERAARAARRARHLPRLARRRASWRAPTRAPTCSCSPAGPTRSAR